MYIPVPVDTLTSHCCMYLSINYEGERQKNQKSEPKEQFLLDTQLFYSTASISPSSLHPSSFRGESAVSQTGNDLIQRLRGRGIKDKSRVRMGGSEGKSRAEKSQHT